MKKLFLLFIGLMAINSLWAVDQFTTVKYDTLVKTTSQGVQIVLETTTEEILADYQSTYSLEGREWLEMYENEIWEKRDSVNILSQIFPPRTKVIQIIDSYYPSDGVIENNIELMISGKEKSNAWYTWFLIIFPLAFFIDVALFSRKQTWRFMLIMQMIAIAIIAITIFFSKINHNMVSPAFGLLLCFACLIFGSFKEVKKYGIYTLFLILLPTAFLIGLGSSYYYQYGQALGLEPVHWQYLIVLAVFCAIGWIFRFLFKALSARKRNRQAKEKILASQKQ